MRGELTGFCRQIDEVKQELKDLRGYVVPPTPKNRPASKYPWRGKASPRLTTRSTKASSPVA
jgi:hypothetical protein